MKRRLLSLTGLLVSAAFISFSGVASAHVVVKPAEVLTAGFQTFTMGVPTEKDIPTVSLKLVMPAGLKYVTPTNKPGWQIDIEKQGSGEAATVSSITWTGGTIEQGFRDDFTFAAQVPDKATDLQWKAYQTYADGSVVSWDKAASGDHESEDENSGPFSVTKVVAEAAATSEVSDNSMHSSNSSADRALAIAVVAALLGLTAIFLTTRKK